MTGCTIMHVEPYHDPNEGRVIYNDNFDCLQGTIANIQATSATGSTIVEAGVNTTVVMTFSGSVPVYTVDVPTSSFTSSVSYTNSAATPTTIGGISAGSTFSALTMQQMWDKLLYPYQFPAFTSFFIVGQTSPLEVGATMAGTSRTFDWSTSNSTNVSGNSISIIDVTSGATLTSSHANNGSFTTSFSNITNVAPATHTWNITALNSNSGSFSDSYSVSWDWRVYYGDNTNPTPDANLVTGLTSSFLSTSFAGTYSFAGGGYKYFAYPSSMGTATTFKDTSTNLNVAMQPLQVISVTNAFGITTNYNVHRSTNILNGSINILIS
jgi:hypothetical protein